MSHLLKVAILEHHQTYVRQAKKKKKKLSWDKLLRVPVLFHYQEPSLSHLDSVNPSINKNLLSAYYIPKSMLHVMKDTENHVKIFIH